MCDVFLSIRSLSTKDTILDRVLRSLLEIRYTFYYVKIYAVLDSALQADGKIVLDESARRQTSQPGDIGRSRAEVCVETKWEEDGRCSR